MEFGETPKQPISTVLGTKEAIATGIFREGAFSRMNLSQDTGEFFSVVSRKHDIMRVERKTYIRRVRQIF